MLKQIKPSQNPVHIAHQVECLSLAPLPGCINDWIFISLKQSSRGGAHCGKEHWHSPPPTPQHTTWTGVLTMSRYALGEQTTLLIRGRQEQHGGERKQKHSLARLSHYETRWSSRGASLETKAFYRLVERGWSLGSPWMRSLVAG